MADNSFDPDKFLSQTNSFDPDKFLGRTSLPQKSPSKFPELPSLFDETGTYASDKNLPASTMPYSQQMKNLGEFSKAFGKGTVAGVLGLPGDILNIPSSVESLGRSGLKKAGYDVSQNTAIPQSGIGSEDIYRKIFNEPKTAAEKAGSQFGEFAGGFVGPEALSQGLKLGTKALVGTTTATREAAAKILEDLGVKLEPVQLRSEVPSESAGFSVNRAKNQKIIDKAVSKETGVETDQINSKFIGQRLEDLKKNYDKIFNRTIQADSSLVYDLTQIRDFERSIRPAGVTPAASAADSIINKYNQLQSIVGQRGKLTAFPVDGEVIRRLRQEMSDIARTAQDGNTRRIAGQFVEKIDNNFLRNHRDLKKLLEETNRKYAATKTLQEGIEKGFIKGGNISLKGLGDYLANNTYGFGSGTTKHPLFDLGNAGREANQTAIWETPDKGKPLLTALGGKTAKILGALGGPIGPRSQFARSAQRRLSEGKLPYKVPEGTSAATGVSTSVTRKKKEPEYITIRKKFNLGE